MKNYPNIEKSAFHLGEYVGYGDGVWRIRKSNSSYGNWIAYKQNATREEMPLYSFRLSDMSDQLNSLATIKYAKGLVA